MKRLLLALIVTLIPLSVYADVILCDGAACANRLGVDATSNAARVTHYDTSGNVLSPANNGVIGVNSGGLALSGKDYKLSRTVRATPTGALATADDAVLFFDSFEGTTRNSTRWVETATTQTATQALATGLTLNASATLTTATGNLQSSHYQVGLIGRSPVVVRFHLNSKGATNALEEWGLSDQSSATTALHNNGAFFRRDGAGSVQPVMAFNGGTEAQGTVMTAPATTEYGYYDILLDDTKAIFSIYSHTGTLLSSQVMEIGTAGAGGAGDNTRARLFASTHLPVMMRTINTGAAGTAPQLLVTQVSAYSLDTDLGRPIQAVMSSMGLNSTVSATTYAQAATWSNSANPGAVTISNTTCGVTTLGGLVNMNAIAGAVTTDLCLVGWQNTTPYTFFFTGVHMGPPQNLVAALATTVTNFTTFGLGFNASAGSLATGAPYPAMRVAIGGAFKCPIALAIGDTCTGSDIDWHPGVPIAVYPGKFLNVITRVPIGTATATETFLFNIAVDGYYE